MRTEELKYDCATNRYVWGPTPFRGRARLLVAERETGKIYEAPLQQLPGIIQKHCPDVPIWVNNSKLKRCVFEVWRKTGERRELMLIDDSGDGKWEALLKAKDSLANDKSNHWEFRNGQKVWFLEHLGRGGRYSVRIDGEPPWEELGRPPYPPKLEKPRSRDEESWYECLYAKRTGGTAVPTAGIDLTQSMLDKLKPKELTLHPAPDNARRIGCEHVEDHARQVRSEVYGFWDDPPPEGPVVAIGSTVVRAVEQYARTRESEGRADVYLCPPFECQMTAALLTQFHYPCDPILALTCAFGGTQLTMDAHRMAVKRKMRIGGYGDLILIV